MLDDLTAEEIVALVHVVKVAEAQGGTLIFVGDTLTSLEGVPGIMSLAEKINEAGDREDVKEYLKENYGESEET